MNTPNKYTFTPYASTPRAKDGQTMYPSQSAEFISFHMGGQSYPKSGNKWHNNRSSRGSYNNRNNSYTKNHNNEGNRDSQQHNVPYFYQDRTPNAQNSNNRPRRFKNQQNHMHGLNNETADITDYVHPSMLEDPWKELVERYESIEASDLELHIVKDETNANSDEQVGSEEDNMEVSDVQKKVEDHSEVDNVEEQIEEEKSKEVSDVNEQQVEEVKSKVPGMKEQ